MAGREQKSAGGVPQADQVRRRGCGQKTVPADNQASDAVAGRNAGQHLDRMVVEIAAVTARNQGSASKTARGVHDALQEILEVARLPEDRDFLSQSRGARALIRKRAGGDGLGDQRSDRFRMVARIAVLYSRP